MSDPLNKCLDETAERYAKALFGGVPAGQLFGMPLLINYDIPNDRIRVIDPRNGETTDILVPPDEPPHAPD